MCEPLSFENQDFEIQLGLRQEGGKQSMFIGFSQTTPTPQVCQRRPGSRQPAQVQPSQLDPVGMLLPHLVQALLTEFND